MPIVSSSNIVGHAQADGRRYVTETHIDDLGAAFVVEYLAAAGADYAAIRTARQAQLTGQLADTEAGDAIAVMVALVLRHQTAAEFAARFWRRLQTAYSQGDKLTYHRLVWWIWQHIQDGDLTSDQVRLSFNAFFERTLNTAQWNSLVTTRFVPMKDRYLAMLAEGAL